MKNYVESSKHFSRRELQCRHTGKCEMNPDFMKILESFRVFYGQKMIPSSAYRHHTHPVQQKKANPFGGDHPKGTGIDILCHGEEFFNLMEALMQFRKKYPLHFNRIGIHQKGSYNQRFIHLGCVPLSEYKVWTY